jgi:GNAT superfamily N-acetyltransferase
VEAIRAIEVDAGERFRDVGLDRIADDPPPTAERLLGYARNGAAWVAVPSDAPDAEPVGHALASVVDGEGHLDQVSVRRSWMGRGLGRALVARVEAWAAERGLETVTLTTYADVPWNGPWYAHLGFERVPDIDAGPELAAILRSEREAGFEPPVRIAMRRRLRP